MEVKRLAILTIHTSPLAPPGGKKVGGMNVYVRELAQELAKLGVAVDIFTRRNSPTDPLADVSLGDNVRVIYLPAGPDVPLSPEAIYPYLSQFTAKLMAFATRYNLHYDMVYSHYWLSGWVAYKLKEAWGIPFIHMFHTLGYMKQRIMSNHHVVPDIRINVETQIAEWADRIIAATPAEQTQLRWLYRAKRRKIAIVPPGVNIERFYPISYDRAKADLGFGKDCNLLLFVGRIEPLKSVDTILYALAVLREQDPHLLGSVCFGVVGGDLDNPDDDELARLQALTHQLGLDKTVVFFGAKDQSLLPTYYAAATAVIMPSDYESFGMVALEAMASGTPVIASNVGGLAFLVQDKKTGFLVPTREPQFLAESIRFLLQDVCKREKMGQSASQLAQEYAWPRIAKQIVTVFDAVIAERTSPRKHLEYSQSVP